MNKKILIIAGAVALVGAIAAALFFFLNKPKTYRNIIIDELRGSADVLVKGKDNTAAYVGMNLYSKDDVTVNSESNLTLVMDSDKYAYAEENTHFWLECYGTEESGQTVINLADGDTLYYLQNPLAENESFDVSTPAGTMSVRGTVFRVKVYPQDGLYYTLLEVFQGKVEVRLKTTLGEYNGVSRVFGEGESALMRASDDFSEFVEPFSADDTADIHYKNITKSMARHIATVIDMQEELSITKELLFDYVEINEHKWIDEVELAATCSEKGVMKTVCEVCGEISGRNDIPALEHKNKEWVITKEATCLEKGEKTLTCVDCGEQCETEEIEALGHKFSNWKTDKEATCSEAGHKIRSCTLCDKKEEESIAKLSHNFGGWTQTKSSTCTSEGSQERTCSSCGTKETESIAKIAHSYGNWTIFHQPINPCIDEESYIRYCSVCNSSDINVVTPALGHSYGSCSHTPYPAGSTISCSRACDRGCGLTQSATGTAGGTCPLCGAQL